MLALLKEKPIENLATEFQSAFLLAKPADFDADGLKEIVINEYDENFNFTFLKIFIFVMAILVTNLKVVGRQIRVATLNLDNYLLANRRVEGRYRPDYPKPEDNKKALREIILATDADILAVQEIGVEVFLLELQRDLRLEGLDYPHTALMVGDDGLAFQQGRVRIVKNLSNLTPHPAYSAFYYSHPTLLEREAAIASTGSG